MKISEPSSNGQQQSSVSVGDPVVDSVLTFDEGDQSLIATPAAPARSRRRPDYRLRGLDLEAQQKNKPAVLPVRKDQPRRRHRRRLLIGWVIVVAVAAGAALLLRGTVIEPFSVPSNAMTPTLHVGDRILVVKSQALAGPIKNGNIIVFHRPTSYACAPGGGTARDLVQRVIGVSGQTIWSVGGTIYVDGQKLKDLKPRDPKLGQTGSKVIPLTTVPAGEYFVMGDNRSQSCDSRSFGAIPASSVVGKVVSIVLRGGHPYIHVL